MRRFREWRERLADWIAPERVPVERLSLRLWPDGEVVIDSGKGPTYRRWTLRIPRPETVSEEAYTLTCS